MIVIVRYSTCCPLLFFFFQATGPTMVCMEVARTATETTETIMEIKETMPAMTVMIVMETREALESKGDFTECGKMLITMKKL